MKSDIPKIIFWLPRILGILFAAFIASFSADVFQENLGIGETILHLLIHLIPSFILILALIIAWRKEIVGVFLYIGLAIFYLLISNGKFNLITYLVIMLPLVIIALLFYLNWHFRKSKNN
jgi:hypothetical protein